MVRNFWRDQKGDKKKITWISWEKLCIPKSQGGMGLKLSKEFNLALSAKQEWKLQTDHNSSPTMFLKLNTFLNVRSYLWRSIMAVQHIVRQGMRWRVENGRKLGWDLVWQVASNSYDSPQSTLDNQAMVSELIDCRRGEWKIDWSVICSCRMKHKLFWECPFFFFFNKLQCIHI